MTRFVGSEMFSPGVTAALRCNGGHAWFGWPSSPRIEESREAWFDAPNLATQRTLAERIQEQAEKIDRNLKKPINNLRIRRDRRFATLGVSRAGSVDNPLCQLRMRFIGSLLPFSSKVVESIKSCIGSEL